MTTKMYQLSINDLRLNHELPWDVYDSNGKLLLCKGYMVSKDSQIENLIARGMFVQETAFIASNNGTSIPTQSAAQDAPPPVQKFNPFWLWDDIQSKLSNSLRNIEQEAHFPELVENYSKLIQFLSDKDADVGISVVMLNDSKKSTISHMMHVAIVVELVSKRLGWPDTKRQTAICTAITMNVSIIELQTRLLLQRSPLTPEQLQEIKSHPHRSYELLKAAGVKNEDWLFAVRDHHENKKGTGYPREINDMSDIAELVHIADVFCAKVTPRAHREAFAPNQVARELFLEHAEGSKNPLPLMLIKEIGIYPPGSFVSLANKETALVTRRGESANTPTVLSLISPNGSPYGGPVKRDTSKKEFAIVGVVPKERVVVRINPSKIWGYD